ncbi:MAG: hypothetical protein JST92_07080 [Deltaproteobacteria bacterium]|nr:hypothetical protein [Deltaproteobacteria bacterium]
MKGLVLAAAIAMSLGAAACSPRELPVVEANKLDDTTDHSGPYVVLARVTARRGIDAVTLVWHNDSVGPGQAVRSAMVQDETTGLWRATIPGSGAGAVIAYHVEATDSEGDVGFAPETAETASRCPAEYCFDIQ